MKKRKVNSLINSLRGSLIVSCQAEASLPFNRPEHLAAMASSAVMGGARGIRASGPENLRAIRKAVDVPVIGIYKKEYPGYEVYITPTLNEVKAIAAAGADILALDFTRRPRPGELSLEALVKEIKANYGFPIMADVATCEEGRYAAEIGADLVATTLSGYTDYSPPQSSPDLQLVYELSGALDIPVVAEGRISNPDDARRAFEAGAFAVVVGSMITRPDLITERFAAAIRNWIWLENVIAIDIGGTKIAGCIVDSMGALHDKRLLPAPASGSAKEILSCADEMIRTLQAKNRHLNPKAIAISTGGQVSVSGEIVGSTEMFHEWTGIPLRQIMEERAGLPAVVLNDGHAAALGEAVYGLGKGRHSILCVVIGTGLGGGLVIDGCLQPGAFGLAGSIGQLRVLAGGDSYLPLEKLVSGPALMEQYNRRTRSGQEVVRSEQVAERAQEGDSVAQKAIQEMGAWLGLGLSHALHIYDVACVVVGGGVAQIGDLLFESARESLKIHAHSTAGETPIYPSALGSRAQLVGAAVYARRRLSGE